MPGFSLNAYLAFEPAVSSHYEVFVVPRLPAAGQSDGDGESYKDESGLLESEWPPTSYVLHIFSSTADRWEEKTFLREGEARGTVADMDSDPRYDRCRYHAVYWRGALYIHCQHGFLTRPWIWVPPRAPKISGPTLLPPHVLAATRQVCKAWRYLVDARLRGHLLSRSVRGIFINYDELNFSEFFSRPSTGPMICGGLDFLPCDGVKVTDHCNGLLLCGDGGERDYVVNPATRRWARLPPRPRPRKRGFGHSAYLAFDPAVSPDYKVFLIPRLLVPSASRKSDNNPLLQPEWPPASCVLHAFFSKARTWDGMTFFREGKAVGILATMDSNLWYGSYHAVYWGGALYFNCQHGYLTRMSFSNHTYTVLRLPGADEFEGYRNHHYRGRSLRGVYCAQNNSRLGLQLWHLDESRDRTEWVLVHDIELETFARKFHATPVVEEKYNWNSDEDNLLDHIEDAAEGNHIGDYCVLGFHPYKEIVYLSLSIGRGVAYDWNNSKFQDLGSLEPKYHDDMDQQIETSFTYTPCWMGQFPGNELESQLEDEKLARRELKLQLESQLEDDHNFTYTCVEEYELRKLRGHTKRAKDSAAKIRRRHRIVAR
ncbi:hypothetical protein ACQ4PT_058356 [Festuca glaucescens]